MTKLKPFFLTRKNTGALDFGDFLNQFQSKYVHELEHLSSVPFFKDLLIQFNTTLPSSAAVERLFSHVGGVFCKKRFQLLNDNFEKQLLLELNLN